MEQERTLVRAQVLMTRDQRRRIERLAEQEGRSLSDVTRRALDAGLDTLEGDTDEAVRRERENLLAMRVLRERALARYGVYQGDLVNEAREERDRQVDDVWKQS
ncbi:MAG: hypothetical protein ACYCYF_07020 [Anaerolineae bacterium]